MATAKRPSTGKTIMTPEARQRQRGKKTIGIPESRGSKTIMTPEARRRMNDMKKLTGGGSQMRKSTGKSLTSGKRYRAI